MRRPVNTEYQLDGYGYDSPFRMEWNGMEFIDIPEEHSSELDTPGAPEVLVTLT